MGPENSKRAALQVTFPIPPLHLHSPVPVIAHTTPVADAAFAPAFLFAIGIQPTLNDNPPIVRHSLRSIGVEFPQVFLQT